MNDRHLGFVLAALLAAGWLLQWSLHRMAERARQRRRRYESARERLINAVEALRREASHRAQCYCRRSQAVVVLTVFRELEDAARPIRGFIPDFVVREAFESLEPANRMPL